MNVLRFLPKQFFLTDQLQFFCVQEDALLILLVEEVGILSWSDLSKEFQHRNGKQCSERYKNYCYE